MKKEDQSPQFLFIAKQLKKVNIDFFINKAKSEKKSFLFEVILSYNFLDSLGNSIDLGCFPFFKNVANEDLSMDQQNELLKSKRNLIREPAKLVSTHENSRRVVDFVDNILYMLTHHSCKVLDVLSITSFETASFFAEYVQSLQIARSIVSSPIQGRIIKNLSNSIPGKLHMRIDTYNHCHVATSKERLLKLASSSDFIDYRYVSPTSCIVVYDGILVRCSNLPSISGRVYRYLHNGMTKEM